MKRLLLALLAATAAFAQAPSPPPPLPPAAATTASSGCAVVSPAAVKLEFDAASIKPAGPFTPGRGGTGFFGGPGTNDPGRASGNRVALASLINAAYGLMADQLSGSDWMGDAINHGFAISATMPDGTTNEQYCGMLRNLLVSRFHLTFHHETQPRPGYELTVLPGGPKFRHYDPQDPGPEPGPHGGDKNGFLLMPPAQPRVMSISHESTGLMKMSFRNEFSFFVAALGGNINLANGITGTGAPVPRVSDKTGLTGVYDIRLEFAGIPMYSGPGLEPIPEPAAAPDLGDVGPNIFNAVQQQLGLKLMKVREVPIDVLVVDHVDQTPTEN